MKAMTITDLYSYKPGWRRPLPNVHRSPGPPGYAWMITPLRFHDGQWQTTEITLVTHTSTMVDWNQPTDDRTLVNLTHRADIWPRMLISSELKSWLAGRVEHLWRHDRVTDLRRRAEVLESTGYDPGPNEDDEWERGVYVDGDEDQLEEPIDDQVHGFLRVNPDPDIVNLV